MSLAVARSTLRTLTVDGQRYLYGLDITYLPTGAGGGYRARYRFTAYLEGAKRSPAYVDFETWEGAVAGGPLHTEQPVALADPSSPRLNLYRPGHAAALIRELLSRGWKPDDPEHQRALEVEGDRALLDAVAERARSLAAV